MYNMDMFRHEMVPVKSGELYGYIDKEGRYVIVPQYEYADVFSNNGLLPENNKIGYIDTKGNKVIPAQFDKLPYEESYACPFFHDGYAVVRVGGKFGIIDKTGSYLVEPQFDGILNFSSIN
jgi:hypothetical protein